MTAPIDMKALLDDNGSTRSLGLLEVGSAGQRIPLPLAKVDLAARVAGCVAEVTLTQVFRNPYQQPLEAVYVFPLPGGCAVSGFTLTVAGRVLRGRVEERQQARETYRKGVENGHRAALMEKERDDVFTVTLGNLPPAQEATVAITWSERLTQREEGTTEIRLPLVVAPRYIPGNVLVQPPVGNGVEEDTDAVPDASRITPPRLAEGLDPGVALGVEVAIQDGEVRDLACAQHATAVSLGAQGVRVTLARADERMDRDFVLRWSSATNEVRPSLLVHRDPSGESFALLTMAAPRMEGFLGLARDVVFVVDRSGSMEGAKIASAARACSVLLGTLGPRDRFAILAFDDRTEWVRAGDVDGPFVAADESGKARGEAGLRSIGANGGTEMDRALQTALQALAARRDGSRQPILVFLTDGQVGNESRILKRAQKELGDARVFAVGVDTAVNEGFLARLASMGGGTSRFVVPGEALERTLREFAREIGTPLATDLEVEGLEGAVAAPSHAPDLFAGRTASILLRSRHVGRVRVRGRKTSGGALVADVEPREVVLPALAHLWARERVAELEDRFRLGEDPEAKKAEIVAISVRHGLLTRFTAYVVVDESEVVNAGGEVRRIVQPVHLPAQWEEGRDQGTRMFCASLAAPASAAPAAMADMECLESLAEEAEGPPASPAQLPEMRARKGRGFLGKVRSLLTPGKGRPGSTKGSSGGPGVPEVRKAFDKLMAEIELVRVEAAAGRIPALAGLEAARKALLDLLNACEEAQGLPLVQRFLRTVVVEVLAALRSPGVTADQLLAVLARHSQEIGEAKRGERFWESSI